MRASAQLWLLSVALLAASSARAQVDDAQRAGDLSAEARALARAGSARGALALYREALELAPGDRAIERDYAVTLGWAGDYRGAVEVFRGILDESPEQPSWALVEMANAELFGGAPDQAFRLFDELVRRRDLREPILTRRALALRWAGHREKAAGAYRDALVYYPDSEQAALGVVQCFLDEQRVADAHTFLATWSGGVERSSEIQAWRAWLLARLNRILEADALVRTLPQDEFVRHSTLVGRVLSLRIAAAWTLDSPRSMPGLDPNPSSLATDLPGVESGMPLTRQARALAADGVELAREGEFATGRAYLMRSIAMAPNDLEIRRDHAIVLTWSERYKEAKREFDRVFREEPDQPAWARSDRAQAELFGGDPEDALRILDGLIREGYIDERNLVRKGLALRWTGRAREAERVYRQITGLYPESSSGPDGMIHSLADQNRLGSAIKAADRGLNRLPDQWDLVKSRAQVLNWAGRHLQAEKTLAAVPEDQESDPTVLHHKALAARWTDDAQLAMRYANAFTRRHPGDRDAYALREELAYQYGYGFQTGFEYFGDTDGFTTRGYRQLFEAPVSISHRLNAGVNRQHLEQRGFLENLTTYNVGWAGQLSRRLGARASAGQTYYSGVGNRDRVNLDVSASYLMTDRVRLSGGFGREPTVALRSIADRVQTNYAYIETDLKPTLKTELSFRAGRSAFGNTTVRHTYGLAALRTTLDHRFVKLRVGARSVIMRHDRPSPSVYSPGHLGSHMGVVQLSGRLAADVDYVAEFGGGLQLEDGSPRTVPVSSTIEIAKRLRRDTWLRLQASYSNSALNRTNSGDSSYGMSYVNIQLDYRLKRKFE